MSGLSGNPHPVAAGQVQTFVLTGSDSKGKGFVLLAGRVGAGVTGVTIHRSNGGDVVASVKDGWYLAWWPARGRAISATVTTTHGSRTIHLPPVATQTSVSCGGPPNTGCGAVGGSGSGGSALGGPPLIQGLVQKPFGSVLLSDHQQRSPGPTLCAPRVDAPGVQLRPATSDELPSRAPPHQAAALLASAEESPGDVRRQHLDCQASSSPRGSHRQATCRARRRQGVRRSRAGQPRGQRLRRGRARLVTPDAGIGPRLAPRLLKDLPRAQRYDVVTFPYNSHFAACRPGGSARRHRARPPLASASPPSRLTARQSRPPERWVNHDTDQWGGWSDTSNPGFATNPKGCDPIDPAQCMLPYPNDWFTRPRPDERDRTQARPERPGHATQHRG